MKKRLVKNKILFCFILVLLMAGCGLKANPVPLGSAVSQSQDKQQLTVSADGKTIVLTWQLQNQAGMLSYIIIEKSQLGSAGNICRDCPRRFEKIGHLQAVNTKNEKKEYRFDDLRVEKGKIYSYRLKLCDEAGICRESQTVEIDFK